SVFVLIGGGAASMAILGEIRALPVGMYLLSGSLSIFIIDALRRANLRAEHSARLAADRLVELQRESAQLAIEEGHSAQLRAIVEFSEDAIISKDIQGIIQSWNVGATKIYGFSAAEAIGQPVAILIPPDRLHEETDMIERLRRGESIKPFETVRRHKDGTQIS